MPRPIASSAIAAPMPRKYPASSQKSGSRAATIQRWVAWGRLMSSPMPNAAYQTPTTSASPASRQPAMRDAGTGSSVTARSEVPERDRAVLARGRVDRLDQLDAAPSLAPIGGRNRILADRADEVLEYALVGARVGHHRGRDVLERDGRTGRDGGGRVGVPQVGPDNVVPFDDDGAFAAGDFDPPRVAGEERG